MDALALLLGLPVLWLAWCFAGQPYKVFKIVLLCIVPLLLLLPLNTKWLFIPLSVIQAVLLVMTTRAAIGKDLADKLVFAPLGIPGQTKENTHWYHRGLWVLLAWPSMAGSTYGQAQLVSILQIAGLVLLVGVPFWFFRKQKPSVEKDRPDLLAAEGTYKAVKTVAAVSNGVLAGEIAGNAVRVSIEDRACVIGPPGTGKTAFLVSQVLDWSDSGRSFVCLDIKPEIYGITRAALEAKGYKVLAYNPTARAGQRYNLLDDIDSLEGLGELAAALVPSDGKNIVFDESARDLLDGVMSHLRAVNGTVSLPAFSDWIGSFDDVKAIFRELKKSPDPQVVQLINALIMTAQNERLLGSIFATLRANLRFIRYPAIRESLAASDFSLKDLMVGKVALFLQFEEASKETTAQLLSVMVGHLLRYFIIHNQRLPVLLLLDEIGNAPVIRGLAQKLNTIRSRNLPTWMYWQSKAQMIPYGLGDSGPDIILGACDVQVVFRVNDNETATWMSEKIGTVDRLVRSISVTQGGGVFGQDSHSHSLASEPVIFPHQLQQLREGEVISTYRGLAWRGSATAYFQRWPQYKGCKPTPSECVGTPYKNENLTYEKEVI